MSYIAEKQHGLEIGIHAKVQIHTTYAKALEQTQKKHAHKFQDSKILKDISQKCFITVLLELILKFFYRFAET